MRTQRHSFWAALAPVFLFGVSAGACGSLGHTSARASAPKPFSLKATLQADHKVSQRVIGRVGGILETTDSQGTRFRLTIPPGALRADTTLTLTPLAQVTGIPGETRHYGVDIAPAGTNLAQLAQLEITPTQPIPRGDLYWFETRGPVGAITAVPGFPAIGQPGVMLSHFSGATVVAGSVAASSAVHQGMDGAPGSVGWFQWQRGVVEQDYQVGRIDKITYDSKNEMIDDLLSKAARDEMQSRLDEATADAGSKLDNLGDKAVQGDLGDLPQLTQAMQDALTADRQNQLLGRQSDLWQKVTNLMKTFYAAKLSRCREKPIPPERLIAMERQAQMIGFQDPEGLFQKCLPPTLQTSGGGNGLSVSGEVKDPAKPFVLQGTFPGGNSTHNYTPTGPGGGTVSASLSGSGATGSIKGAYTIAKDGDYWIIQETTSGCVDGIPNSCRTTTEVITLTSVPAYCRVPEP